MSSTSPPGTPSTSTTPRPGPSAPARLHVRTAGDGPALVLAHGFTQTGRVWGSMDADLAADHRVTAIDMPGHGGSAAVEASLPDGAELLGRDRGRAVYVGYSMGARFCLHLALARPELVEALVLISGTAGIEDPGERRQRRLADDSLAGRLDPASGQADAPTPVADFLRGWMENPMFEGIGPEAGGLEERLANTGPGLASSLRLAGTGTQEPLWAALGTLDMPVLIISGGNDEKFTALGRRMAEAIGDNATHVVVDGTGHAPHLQQPDQVALHIRSHISPPSRG